jgi:hypothetical protein
MSQWCKRLLCASLIALVITFRFGFIEAQPALAANPIQVAENLLSNKQLVRDAKRFLNMTPEAFCGAYFDKVDGVDSPTWRVIEEGAAATATVTGAISSASAAGAGALSGYAGIASAVSQLGLGGLTSAAAGAMGSSASGAAATAVVTSAVGGPVVMGALIIGGTGVAAFGTYEAGKFAVEKLGNLAEGYCNFR